MNTQTLIRTAGLTLALAGLIAIPRATFAQGQPLQVGNGTTVPYNPGTSGATDKHGSKARSPRNKNTQPTGSVDLPVPSRHSTAEGNHSSTSPSRAASSHRTSASGVSQQATSPTHATHAAESHHVKTVKPAKPVKHAKGAAPAPAAQGTVPE
jgi:hypothetical protein